ncbi:MAG TPA: translational machinery protein [Gallionellaceae bacterium]|nr:translational machinery protein [Gallionellaceae bacterium]
MSHYHAVVWIDHAEAHVMHISPDDVESSVVRPKNPHQKLHHKRGMDNGGAVGSGRTPEDRDFYHDVVGALKGAQEILIVGPANAKLNLVKHIHSHDAGMSNRVIGVESVDHPTDAQLVVYARKYFTAADRMRPQQ